MVGRLPLISPRWAGLSSLWEEVSDKLIHWIRSDHEPGFVQGALQSPQQGEPIIVGTSTSSISFNCINDTVLQAYLAREQDLRSSVLALRAKGSDVSNVGLLDL